MAVALVFDNTLGGKQTPYRGKYQDSDRLAFRKIWATVAREGHVVASNLNYGTEYTKTIRPLIAREDVWDDRWTCAGLGEVLIHVARAITGLSILWHKHRETVPDESEKYLLPSYVHTRAIQDVSDALGIDSDIIKALVGTEKQIAKMTVKMIFPTMKWVPRSTKSKRPPGLWDAFYASETIVEHLDSPATTRRRSKYLDDDDEGQLADGESDSDEYGKKSKKVRKGKSATRRRKPTRESE